MPPIRVQQFTSLNTVAQHIVIHREMIWVLDTVASCSLGHCIYNANVTPGSHHLSLDTPKFLEIHAVCILQICET